MPGKKIQLLLVDDEENILNALYRIFRDDPSYEITIAHSAQDALQKISSIPVDIVISDQRMPGMGGAELLQEIRNRYPDSIRFLLSGYADVEAIISAINEGDIYRFVKKPWNNEELKNLVKGAVGQRDISRIISEAVFRARRIINISKDLEIYVSEDKKNLHIKLKDSSKIIPAESILRLIDFIIGAIESEDATGKRNFAFTGGMVNKKEGRIILSVDLGKDLSLTIEFPSVNKP